MVLRGFIFQLVPPEIAAFLPGDFFLGALHYDAFFDGGAILHRGVGGFFQGDDFSATEAAVGGDQELGFAIGDAVGNGRGAEAAEDYGMHGADAGAGEHGDGQLGDHGHIDGDAIAGLDAERAEHVGELADAFVEFGEGVLDGGAVFGFPHQRGFVGVLFQVTVEAVVGDVELAADEPFGVGRIPFENFFGSFEPVEELGLFAPEGFGIGCGGGVHFTVILERANTRLFAELFGRRDGLLF